MHNGTTSPKTLLGGRFRSRVAEELRLRFGAFGVTTFQQNFDNTETGKSYSEIGSKSYKVHRAKGGGNKMLFKVHGLD
jgi:hypothetical protein